MEIEDGIIRFVLILSLVLSISVYDTTHKHDFNCTITKVQMPNPYR